MTTRVIFFKRNELTVEQIEAALEKVKKGGNTPIVINDIPACPDWQAASSSDVDEYVLGHMLHSDLTYYEEDGVKIEVIEPLPVW